MTALEALALICSLAVQPCIVIEDQVLIPDYIPPHIHIDDLPSFEIEGLNVRAVHLGMDI